MKKFLFIFLGCCTFTLGTIGIFLPGLPTTGFYLITAYLWLHSSKKLYKKFISSNFYQKNIEKTFIKKQLSTIGQIKLFLSMFFIFLIPCFLVNTPFIWILLMFIYIAHVIGLSIYFNFDKIRQRNS